MIRTPLRRFALVAALLATAPAAQAHDAVPARRPAPWKPPVNAVRPAPRPTLFMPGVAGMIVALDPESGAIGMPTARQVAELSLSEEVMLSRSDAGLVPQYLPDGSIRLDLQGRFQEFSVARIGADGRIVHECLGDIASVRRALSTPLPRPVVLEDR